VLVDTVKLILKYGRECVFQRNRLAAIA